MNSTAALHIALIADHSVQRLSQLIEGDLAKHGITAVCHVTEGDDGLSEAMDDESPVFQDAPTVALISISTPALRERYYSARDTATRGHIAEAFIEQLDALIENLRRRQMRILITTLAQPVERIFGHLAQAIPTSLGAQVRQVNGHLHHCAKQGQGLLLVDVEHLASLAGLGAWYDDRLWYHAKYPCHPRNLGTIATSFTSVLRTLRGKVTKCIVLDLDNTLWGGVIGDDGLEGISLGGVGAGEAYRDFQRHLRILKDRGLLLCVCSKNEEANAMLPFLEHDAMVLKPSDIALFVANWRPKSENIQWIASTLNIGLDSIAFIDDSIFEREEVRQALPMVQVPEMPEDPSLFVRTLEQAGILETTAGETQEDAMRTELYRAEGARRQLQEAATNAEDYLASLDIQGTFRSITAQHLQRAAQLIARSNQFNLRTQRVSQEELAAWSVSPAYGCFCVNLEDRFGDYGMISVVCGHIEGDNLFIHEFVMSCRVLARGVEQFILNSLVSYSRNRGVKCLIGEYLPTAKNGLVSDLYPRLGFQSDGHSPNRWVLCLDGFTPLSTHVNERPEEAA